MLDFEHKQPNSNADRHPRAPARGSRRLHSDAVNRQWLDPICQPQSFGADWILGPVAEDDGVRNRGVSLQTIREGTPS
jgi:hypothetical protein